MEDSDLCVFLVDNKDNANEGVLKEQKRARELKKKAIYVFCKENEKEPTQMQSELEHRSGEKHLIIHTFEDFIEKTYMSIMNDVVEIYRKECQKPFIVEDLRKKQKQEDKGHVYSRFIIDKQVLQGFDLTRAEIARAIYSYTTDTETPDPSSSLDKQCSILAAKALGNDISSQVNFSCVTDELCKIHEEFLRTFIKHRVRAIEAYFANDLDSCIEKLENAYNESIRNKMIPNWLVNDVLIGGTS